MVTPHTVITSWSADGEKLYGERFVEGFESYWGTPHGIYLDAYTDWQLTSIDPDIMPFRARELDEETMSGSYRRGSLKWSWKVFAVALTEHQMMEGWMIWIDGDVEFFAIPSDEFFHAVCPIGADVSFLGRPWAYASETGFVAYNMRSRRTLDLLHEMRRTYMSGEYRALDNWGDAAVFDHCRGKLDLIENDLAKDVPHGDLHVWPATVLGSCMSHQKGHRRKKTAYGGTV